MYIFRVMLIISSYIKIFQGYVNVYNYHDLNMAMNMCTCLNHS